MQESLQKNKEGILIYAKRYSVGDDVQKVERAKKSAEENYFYSEQCGLRCICPLDGKQTKYVMSK